MSDSAASLDQLSTTSKNIVGRLVIIAENRLELLAVEIQQERDRLLHAFLLALAIAALGLLAAIALSAAITLCLWTWSPVAVLFALTLFYALAGFALHRQLNSLLKNWQSLSASLEQLRKDREGLEKLFT